MPSVPAFQNAMLKFGKNSDVDTAAAETIWDGGGAYSFLANAELHNIASAGVNAADDTATTGDGARTIRVIGLDENWDDLSEDVAMNGTTPVSTTNKFLRIFRMYVLTAGDTGANAGAISATAAVSSSVSAQMTIGYSQTLMAVYSLPRNVTGYLKSYYASVNKKTSAVADVLLKVRTFGDDTVFQTKHVLSVSTTGTNYLQHRFETPLKIAPKSDIQIVADVSANDTDVSAGFDVWLYRDLL